jgi:hypothetical protein
LRLLHTGQGDELAAGFRTQTFFKQAFSTRLLHPGFSEPFPPKQLFHNLERVALVGSYSSRVQ